MITSIYWPIPIHVGNIVSDFEVPDLVDVADMNGIANNSHIDDIDTKNHWHYHCRVVKP